MASVGVATAWLVTHDGVGGWLGSFVCLATGIEDEHLFMCTSIYMAWHMKGLSDESGGKHGEDVEWSSSGWRCRRASN